MQCGVCGKSKYSISITTNLFGGAIIVQVQVTGGLYLDINPTVVDLKFNFGDVIEVGESITSVQPRKYNNNLKLL